MNSRDEHPEQSEAWHRAAADLRAIEERLRDLRAQEKALLQAKVEAVKRTHRLWNREAHVRAFNQKFRTITKRARLKDGGLLVFTRYEPRKAAA